MSYRSDSLEPRIGDRVQRIEPVLIGDQSYITQGGFYDICGTAPHTVFLSHCRERAFNESAFDLVRRRASEPAVPRKTKTVTETTISCASGGGAELTIDFDKDGTFDRSGPCIGFQIGDGQVDIEDWDTLCELRKNLDRFSVDFRQAMKKNEQ